MLLSTLFPVVCRCCYLWGMLEPASTKSAGVPGGGCEVAKMADFKKLRQKTQDRVRRSVGKYQPALSLLQNCFYTDYRQKAEQRRVESGNHLPALSLGERQAGLLSIM